MLEKSLQTQKNILFQGWHFDHSLLTWLFPFHSIFQWKTEIICSNSSILTGMGLLSQRDCECEHDTYRFLSIKKYNFIELPTFPAAFIPDKVIMSIIPMKCTICRALFSSHYTAIKGSHNSEVIDYVIHCCRKEFSPASLLSLHYQQNLKSSL